MPQKMKMTKRWHWLTPSLTRAALSISRKVTHLFTCLGIFGPGHVAAAAVTNTFLWLVWKIFFGLRVPSCICDWSQTHTLQKEQTVKFWIILWLYLWFRQVFDNNNVIIMFDNHPSLHSTLKFAITNTLISLAIDTGWFAILTRVHTFVHMGGLHSGPL